MISISWKLVRYSPAGNRLLYYSAGAFVAVQGTTLLIRALLWQFDTQQNLFDAGLSHSIHFLLGLIGEVGLDVIFLMMNSQRTESDLITSRTELNSTVAKLEKALSEVKTLQVILPICSHCKKIRDDQGSWQGIEKYVHERSDAHFSHGICPTCAKKHHPDLDIYDESQ